jgi:lactate dehydrogenase-like 2-hydroxyacid dehydrogenase
MTIAIIGVGEMGRAVGAVLAGFVRALDDHR